MKHRQQQSSLNMPLRGLLISLCLFTLIVLIVMSVGFLKEIETTADRSVRNTINICCDNVTYTLRNAKTELDTVLYHYTDLNALRQDDATARYFASVRLADVMKERVFLNGFIDILLLYRNDGTVNIFRAAATTDLRNKYSFLVWADQAVNQTTKYDDNVWKIENIGDRTFFVYCIPMGDLSLFCFVNTGRFFEPLNDMDVRYDEQYILTAEDESVIARYPEKVSDTEKNNELSLFDRLLGQMNAQQTLPLVHGNVYCVISRANLFATSPLMLVFIAILFFMFFVLVVVIRSFFRHEIIQPLSDLFEMTEHIRNGDTEFRQPISCQNAEFHQIYDSFVSMVDELVSLRIASYERRITMSDMELKYYRMQLKPHFFLNTLTTIHSMSRNHQFEEIESFIEALQAVLRYMFKTGLHTVPLSEEIQYVKKYIELQDKLYQGALIPIFELGEDVDAFPIPHMLLYTYVENVYKHALCHDQTVLMQIQAHICEQNGTRMLELRIEDTGDGFDSAMLDYLNEVTNESPKPDRIGLSNINKTLKLLYGRDHVATYSNMFPHGACILLRLPETCAIDKIGET